MDIFVFSGWHGNWLYGRLEVSSGYPRKVEAGQVEWCRMRVRSEEKSMEKEVVPMKKIIMIFGILAAIIVPAISLAGEDVIESQAVNHMAVAKQYEQEMHGLGMRIQNLENRIAHLSEKPYFDPKGFRRSQSQLLLTKLQVELLKLQGQIAWHYQQANQDSQS